MFSRNRPPVLGGKRILTLGDRDGQLAMDEDR
jgi:hypothetical protein